MPRLRMVHMFLWYLIYGHPLNEARQKRGNDGEKTQGLNEDAAVIEAQPDGTLEIVTTVVNPETSAQETEVDLSSQTGKKWHILTLPDFAMVQQWKIEKSLLEKDLKRSGLDNFQVILDFQTVNCQLCCAWALTVKLLVWGLGLVWAWANVVVPSVRGWLVVDAFHPSPASAQGVWVWMGSGQWHPPLPAPLSLCSDCTSQLQGTVLFCFPSKPGDVSCTYRLEQISP